VPMPRKSQTAHWLQGTTSQAKADRESVFVAGKPKSPAHLTPAARKEWKRVCTILASRKTQTEGDYAALALYAEVYSRWVESKAAVAKDGLMVTVTVMDSNGQPTQKEKLHPLLRVVQDCETRLLTLSKSLGLTPDTREKVKQARTNPLADEVVPGSVAETHPELCEQFRKEKSNG
jgi:P27 family predicted phage terminase small subunit